MTGDASGMIVLQKSFCQPNLTLPSEIKMEKTQSTSLWITFWNKVPKVVDSLNYQLSVGDVFKVVLEDDTNFTEGESLSTSKGNTTSKIISKKFGVIQLEVTEVTHDSSFKVGTEVDNSSDFVWRETKIATSERIFSVGSYIDITPDNTTDLQDFEISPSLTTATGLNWDSQIGRIYGTQLQQ